MSAEYQRGYGWAQAEARDWHPKRVMASIDRRMDVGVAAHLTGDREAEDLSAGIIDGLTDLLLPASSTTPKGGEQ